ncbi:MAG: tetratricopeptide repeat protein [Bacteroidales bacterium]|nr:tetratricopeptide repeat protein [Bacteroidales bacterium]
MKTIKIFALTVIMMMPAFSAFSQQYGKTPEDSVNCLISTSLYREAFKNKMYVEAYEPWRNVINFCPASNKNLYIRGVTILKAVYNTKKTVEGRDSIVDELMNMYDLRIEYFGEAAEVTGRKAMDLEQLGGPKAVKEYYALYAEAMSLGATQLEPVVIEHYFDATIKYVTSSNGDTTMILDNYDLATEALSQIASDITDSAKRVVVYQVMANIENKVSPFASCDELVSIYRKKFEANPDDVEMLKKITTMLRKKGCMKSDLFFAATEQLYKLEPSPATAYLMGQMCYNKDKFSEAARYINDALKDAEDAKDKYNMYILLGLCYANTNSYGAARSAYQNAASVDPNNGEPYRLIAQLYAKGHRAIDDGLGGRTAYWAAVDAARRAISVDDSPENVAAANRLIGTYSASFPKQSDAFMIDLIDGQSYFVPGWIGVSTTVRTRK